MGPFILALGRKKKPKIRKLVKNLFRPFHMKEHVRIIDENKKEGARLRNLRRRDPFLFF